MTPQCPCPPAFPSGPPTSTHLGCSSALWLQSRPFLSGCTPLRPGGPHSCSPTRENAASPVFPGPLQSAGTTPPAPSAPCPARPLLEQPQALAPTAWPPGGLFNPIAVDCAVCTSQGVSGAMWSPVDRGDGMSTLATATLPPSCHGAWAKSEPPSHSANGRRHSHANTHVPLCLAVSEGPLNTSDRTLPNP